MLLLKFLSADKKKNLDFIYLDNQRSICNNLLPKEMILRYLVIVISELQFTVHLLVPNAVIIKCSSFIMSVQVLISAGPGGKLSVLLKSFSNPSNVDLNGQCCDATCRSCDYYLKICLKQTSGGSCVAYATTKTYDNTKYIVFKVNEAFSSGGRNPVVWAFSSWKVI